LLAFAQHLLGLLALGNIPHNPNHADDLARRIAQRAIRMGCPTGSSVRESVEMKVVHGHQLTRKGFLDRRQHPGFAQ